VELGFGDGGLFERAMTSTGLHFAEGGKMWCCGSASALWSWPRLGSRAEEMSRKNELGIVDLLRLFFVLNKIDGTIKLSWFGTIYPLWFSYLQRIFLWLLWSSGISCRIQICVEV
jgi:hypothetical protein